MGTDPGRPDDGTTLTLPDDTSILITRRFKAPAALVYQVLTQPEHIRRWWAPVSRASLLEVDVDLKVGGKWRYVMEVVQDKSVFSFSGEYVELSPPHRLVYTEIFDPMPDQSSTVVVTLEETDGVTLMSNHASYPSKEVRDAVIASGMEGGMRESMLQLSALVDELAA